MTDTIRRDAIGTGTAGLSVAVKWGLLIAQCAVIAAGFLWLPPAQGFMNPPLARIVVFHVPCSIVASIASIVATWYAVRYLHRRRVIDDVKSRVSFTLALIFWALTTVTGAIFAKVQWGAYWNWDIKQTSILMLLLIYVAYFALRASIETPHKQATLGAAYAIFAVASMPYLTYILPNSTPDTSHPKGVLTSRDGLDPRYSLVLWSGVFCLSMVYVWAFRVHVAVEALLLRCRADASALNPSASVVITAGQPTVITESERL